MPTEAARKKAHFEWYTRTDDEFWSDEEKWRDFEPEEYRAFLAMHEETLLGFKRNFLQIGPLRPTAEKLGAYILLGIGKSLKYNDINVAALLVNRPLFDLIMHLWDVETAFLNRLFPGEDEATIDVRRLSETIALQTLAQVAVSSPRCIYRESLTSISFVEDPNSLNVGSSSNVTSSVDQGLVPSQ